MTNKQKTDQVAAYLLDLEQQVIKSSVTRESADFEACLYLQQVDIDKAGIQSALSEMTQRWLRLTPIDLIAVKRAEIEQLQQEKLNLSERRAISERESELTRQIKQLSQL